MIKTELSQRLTHRYVGTYRDLDEWRDIGTATLTPARLVREAEGYDDGGTYIRWATFPRGQDIDASIRAVEDTLTSSGCAHEWDCCGCASVYTRVLHRHGRRAVFKTSVTYNY